MFRFPNDAILRLMLLELRVENYAVIDQVTVEFGYGLNLLTGETGAGKSILIDALALLMGDKASPEVIRHGAEKAVISCVFDSSSPQIARILNENGLESGSEELILKREIAAKSRVWINNQPATVAVLRQLAPQLVTIHAQNETVLAFDPPARLKLLDSFASISTESLAEKYFAWRELRSRIEELERSEQDRLRLVDLWTFQKREIDTAKLELGEDQRLEIERKVLMNSEKLYSVAMSAYDLLYESPNSVLSTLAAAMRQVEDLARFDSKFGEFLKTLYSAKADIEDVSTSARDYADGMDASPERLAEIEDRLATIDRLKRKYGNSLEEILAFGEDLTQKLDEIENREEILRGLRKQLASAADDYLAEAQGISRNRATAARKLEKLVEGEINELAMNARFHIEVNTAEGEANWSSSGLDSVAYLISTNPGEPMSPIEKIASGGELSRVMLALKTSVEAGQTRTNGNGKPKRSVSQRTLVFDEIDTGIGGRAAEAVGKKLKALGARNQVLCVTHLPQIASFADQHLLIDKSEAGGRTHTTIRQLDTKERTEEIARMLSGAKLTDASLKHAEQMLKANA
ncbi:MAG TPA: DNA repair protein RecN [Terriglobales bacterium]|nr:DNA repair protein RecN [Terriglobales bacterium]